MYKGIYLEKLMVSIRGWELCLVDLFLPIVGVELLYSAARISATCKAVSLGGMATWWPLMMSVSIVFHCGQSW